MSHPGVTIHYARNVIRDLRAACGSSMRADTDRFSNSLDTVDCEACLATDECLAQAMEDALTPSVPVHFIHEGDNEARTTVCGMRTLSLRCTASLRQVTCVDCRSSETYKQLADKRT